ncbi:hypothetical protein KY290_005547 [Solanum tuberosum]|uniref:SWIM-type domain-containing protein n=2 Tax=Solanum tuberosum TaxID=4113 RepID=A0ABQ7WEV9_SOLTU|nr:hypothetical protein KY289_005964 [Solanum tuberosum]KAH0779120.1 hypothetical protein KY290_005547 [Solanum tuberosum]
MRRLVSNEAKVRSWKGDFSPPYMKLYNVYREIAHGCKVEFNGDFSYEVTEGDDRHTINLKDKRCTCRAWDLSGIPSLHAIKAMLYDKDNTQGASSSSRNCKKKCNDTTSTPRIHHSGGTNDEAEIEFQTEVETQQSVYSTTQPYGPEVDTEEDLSLRPMVVYEVTRLEERKKKPKPTIGSRRIRFTGDASGVSLPINLSYSPTKTIWKGRAATTLHQLQNEGKKKRLKMMVRKGQGIPDNDDNDVNF